MKTLVQPLVKDWTLSLTERSSCTDHLSKAIPSSEFPLMNIPQAVNVISSWRNRAVTLSWKLNVHKTRQCSPWVCYGVKNLHLQLRRKWTTPVSHATPLVTLVKVMRRTLAICPQVWSWLCERKPHRLWLSQNGELQQRSNIYVCSILFSAIRSWRMVRPHGK